MSMSDYHPESWNPSWSVETLLVGLQSFMYEESQAIGSLRGVPTAERRRLAQQSKAFNARNGIYRELFGEGASGGGSGAAGGGGAEEMEEVHESVCRFCFSSEGELISPHVQGEQRVGAPRLPAQVAKAWSYRSRHPKYQTNIDTVYNVPGPCGPARRRATTSDRGVHGRGGGGAGGGGQPGRCRRASRAART